MDRLIVELGVLGGGDEWDEFSWTPAVLSRRLSAVSGKLLR